MELQDKKSIVKQLLDETEALALRGQTSFMDNNLLGFVASGYADSAYHDSVERIEAVGYAKTILPFKKRISRLHMQGDDSKERQHYMHVAVFSLLHAASMVHRDCYRRALIFVENLNDPLAREAVRDYYPSIKEASLSMLEHHKERNLRNMHYFHDLQASTLQRFPEVGNIKPDSEWDAYVMSTTPPETYPLLPHKDADYL